MVTWKVLYGSPFFGSFWKKMIMMMKKKKKKKKKLAN
jgi:hypothetical protein